MSSPEANRSNFDRAGSHSAETTAQRDASWHRRPVALAPSAGLSYPATGKAIGAARRQVVRTAREAGASPAALADIALAVSEASTNAVVHAYTSAGTRGEAFRISTASKGALFTVWITDDGQGGIPDIPRSGLGKGLELMARVCELVLIGVRKDGRTQVEMRFDLRVAATP